MAILKTDELNNLRSSIVKQRLRNYFVPMEITAAEVDKRTDLAFLIYSMTREMFALAESKRLTDEEEDLEDILYAFYYDKYEEILREKGVERSNFAKAVGDIVATTVNYDGAYYTSAERAILIAQNESNSVFAYEDEQRAIREGKTLKTWLTMLDERVREDHIMMEKVTVGINEFFDVAGYKMFRPMDDEHGAPPEEIINCRCVCKYT